ncbi:ThiF family adenylyltransferase [Cryptosporangium phraense]|uniref:ThiF family adenylyltransferase n=1 Tax=Cryptosporangium phraense TaxID=2593070 RepID=A0A545AZJ0_9ACTN|nr:ThiF family adenylyltransferase [Cryptosporangium phraense]TQS46763.1 ThiF family adenylyltransferase [Cryptosporangium phraense]
MTGAGSADRFDRQHGIPGWDQQRLAAATVVVAGVGALGNEVAKNLALAGVGRLILCDPDTVSLTNLPRTVLLGPDDIGRPKVVTAREALSRLAPGCVIETRQAELAAGVGLSELADADVVVGCLDSRHARLRLLGRCALVGARLVDGGTHPWGGEVRLRLEVDEACYGCSLTPHQRGEADLPWSCADPLPGGEPAPASILSTAVVGGWQSLAASALVLGTPPPYRVLRIDGRTGRTAPVLLTRDGGCPYHRPLEGPRTHLPIDHRATVAELLLHLPADADPAVWTAFPVSGHCGACGRRYDPPGLSDPLSVTDSESEDGTAQTRSGGVDACGHCGAPLGRPRLSERLRDAESGRRLYEYGVAPGEILPVLTPEGGYRWFSLNGAVRPVTNPHAVSATSR